MRSLLLKSRKGVPRLKLVFPFLKAGIKIVYPYGKLSDFLKLTLSLFIIIRYLILQNVNRPFYVRTKLVFILTPSVKTYQHIFLQLPGRAGICVSKPRGCFLCICYMKSSPLITTQSRYLLDVLAASFIINPTLHFGIFR